MVPTGMARPVSQSLRADPVGRRIPGRVSLMGFAMDRIKQNLLASAVLPLATLVTAAWIGVIVYAVWRVVLP